MPFEVALKMRNFSELQARVNHSEHVSAQEMVAKYEPLASDYQAVVNWLTSQGFTITRRDGHHMVIFARGTVSQIAQATHANFARVTFEGKEYTSAVTAPSVPASIASLLISINGLQPHIHAHHHLLHPDASSANGVYYSPAQIAQAYQVTGLYNNNITGVGQTIAIVIDAFPQQSDLVAFWDGYGINQSINNFSFIQAVTGSQSYSGQQDPVSGEETLDTEWSSSMAPGAKIRVYNTADLEPIDLDAGYQDVLNDVTTYGIHQMSMSYGLGETESTNGQMNTDDGLFLQLANAGVTCFAASGDDGSTPGYSESGAQNEDGSLEVENPASDPYVIGVGGTTLTLDANNNESTEVVWNEADTSNFPAGASGGGTSGYFSRPSWQQGTGVIAGSYRLVPDISCAADPNYGADYYYTDPTYGLDEGTGGTSWATPTCAAFCALINQARANLGLPAIGQSAGTNFGTLVYRLIGTANFRDITSGGNDTPLSDSSHGRKYQATTGYDEATGIGVPLMQTLTETIAGTQALVGVGLSSPLITVVEGANATIAATASGSPVSYQWQRMAIGTTFWASLSNTGAYTGTSTSTLNVSNMTTGMSGDQFRCVATYAGAITVNSSQQTTLIVETPWTISTVAGQAGTTGFADSNTGTDAEFNYPSGVVVDSSGNLYITDLQNNVIRKVTLSGTAPNITAAVTTPYGSLSGTAGHTDASGNSALFNAPRDIAIDSSNNLYVTDEGSEYIRKINTTTKAVTTIAGTSSTTSPIFIEPKGICVDKSGNVYVADSGNNVIRKITTGGTVSIFAGSSSFTAGYANGAATTQALFNEPIGLAIDGSGNLYVTEYNNEVVRKISNGVVSTIAGQEGIAGCLDGTATTQALFNVPRGIMVDSSGNLYVTDSYAPVAAPPPELAGNNLLRKISSSGVVTTLAGQAGIAGSADGSGNVAQFYNPCGLAMNSSGKIYVTDASNNTIRSAVVETIAVSVSATVPYASLNGGIAGQFTFSRTGSTSGSLTVNYSVAGTAVGNTDYSASNLTGSVTIPDGVSSATITVTPLTNTNTPSRTVQVTITGTSNAGVTFNSTPATVTISEVQPVGFNLWESNHSISGAAAAAMPLNDGVPTYMKYFYDINPSVPITGSELAALPTEGATTIGGTSYLTLTYHEAASETGAVVTAQTSPDLQTWTTLPSSAIVPIGIDPTTNDLIMQAQAPLTTTPQFIRLNIAQP